MIKKLLLIAPAIVLVGCVFIKDMDVVESDVNLMTMGQEQQMAHGVTESELGAQQHESASASIPLVGE